MGSVAAYRLDPIYNWEEKQCRRCEEWWPLDEEFFRFLPPKGKKKGRFHAWCRCCELEYNVEWKEKRRNGGCVQ